jgi:hypothetical protein
MLKFFGRIKRTVLLLLLAFVASCAAPEIEKAFGPEMKPEDSRKTILNYCQSCHNHKNFTAATHYDALKKKNVPDAGTSFDCRVCHTYSKNWLFDVKRGTHRMKESG